MLDTLLLRYSSVSLILEIRVNLPADSNFQHHEKKVVLQFLTKKRQTSLIKKRKFEICAMWKNQSVVSLGFWWEKVRATLRNLKFCYKLMYGHTITLLIRNLTLFCVSFFGCRFYMDGAAIYVQVCSIYCFWIKQATKISYGFSRECLTRFKKHVRPNNYCLWVS